MLNEQRNYNYYVNPIYVTIYNHMLIERTVFNFIDNIWYISDGLL